MISLKICTHHSLEYQPQVINTDKNPAYGEAIAELKKEGLLTKETRHRQVKYLIVFETGDVQPHG